MNNFFNKKNRGFTIVETLVAVAILMISIAGPLTIAQKGLMAALYARDQVTASFLAQELMENIKNTRDGYVQTPGSSFAQFIADKITNAAPSNTCPVAPVQLYTDTNGRYVISGGTPSRFYRSYCFELPINSNNEVKAVVRVQWANGTIDNEVKLENELFNIQR